MLPALCRAQHYWPTGGLEREKVDHLGANFETLPIPPVKPVFASIQVVCLWVP